MARLIAIFYNERKKLKCKKNKEQITLESLASLNEVPYIDALSERKFRYLIPKSKEQLLYLLNNPEFLQDMYNMNSEYDVRNISQKYDLATFDGLPHKTDYYSILLSFYDNDYYYRGKDYAVDVFQNHIDNEPSDAYQPTTQRVVETVFLPFVEKIAENQVLLVNDEEVNDEDTAIDFEINHQSYHLSAWNAVNPACTCVIDTDNNFEIVSHQQLNDYNKHRLVAVKKVGKDIIGTSCLTIFGNCRVYCQNAKHNILAHSVNGNVINEYPKLRDIEYINLLDSAVAVLQKNIFNQEHKFEINVGKGNYLQCQATVSFNNINYAKKDAWSIQPVMKIDCIQIKDNDFRIINRIIHLWLQHKLQTLAEQLQSQKLEVEIDNDILTIVFDKILIQHPQQFVFAYHDDYHDYLVLMLDKMMTANDNIKTAMQQIRQIKQLFTDELSQLVNYQSFFSLIDEQFHQIKEIIIANYLTQLNDKLDEMVNRAKLKQDFDCQIQQLRHILKKCNDELQIEINIDNLLEHYQKMFDYQVNLERFHHVLDELSHDAWLL